MNLPTLDGPPVRSRLLVAHPDTLFTVQTHRYFQQQGWEVWQAGTALEVRSLMRKVRPNLIVLATELPDESGWLTCAKLVRQDRRVKIILVEAVPTWESRRFAAFVGAAGLVAEAEAGEALLEEVADTVAS